MRRARTLVCLLAISTLAIAVAACTGSSSGDDDDVASPSPTPVFVPDGCQIVWLTRLETESMVDFFAMDAPIAAWVSGTNQYASAGASGTFYRRYDLLTGTYQARAAITTGSFALLATTSAGSLARFEDTTPQEIFLLDSAGTPVASQGTSGTGIYQGPLSDPYSANVAPGTGQLTVLFQGTSRTLGGDLSYAICYTGTSPLKPGPGLRGPGSR